jgi:hypothetical protein
MSLLKKTESKKDDRKREILDVEIDNAVKDKFANILENECNLILENDDINFVDFFSGSGSDVGNSIFILSSDDMERVGTLFPILAQIQCEDDKEYVRTFNDKTINNIQTYAICIQKSNEDANYKETCIYFRKYGKGYRIANHGLLSFKNGKFEKIDSDIFKCDNFIDAIYYEITPENNDDAESDDITFRVMLVKSINNFEVIFAFHELYKTEGKKIYDFFESHDNIEIQEGLFEIIKDKISYFKNMTQLSKKNIINDFDFDETKRIYDKANTNYIFNFKIENDKIIIEDKEGFKDFLVFCGKEIVRDPLDDNIFMKSSGSKEFPRRR